MSGERPNGVRDRIERSFEVWGRFAFRHALPIVLVMLVLSAALAAGIPSLEIDNSTDSFLHADDPIRVQYDAFRRQFGRDERISVAIETSDIAAADFLNRLKALHDDLEREVPHVEDLVSLVNARNTRGEGDELIVEELLESWPRDAAERAALRERVLANPLYRNTLVSRDARITTVSIELVAFADDGTGDDLTGGFEDDAAVEAPLREDGERAFLPEQEISAAVRAARRVVARHQAPDFQLRMAGGPVMAERLNVRMQQDMGRFTALSVLAIGLFLFLLFRRVAAIFLPLLVVALSMLSTLGVMAMLGGKVSVATQLLPSLLLAVGVCDAVHILAIFYQRIGAGSEREDAVAFTLGHSGLAIVMTSLTTAGGFASFLVGELKPVAELGIYAPLGVTFALVYTIVLMPALLALIPTRPPARRVARGEDRVSRMLRALGSFAATRPWSIVSVTVAVLVVAGMGGALLRFSHDPMDWFPEGEPFREATLFMNQRLDGVNVVELLVHTKRENGVQDPAVLNQLDELRRTAARIHRGDWHIGKTISLADIVKEIHQALNENHSEYYAIPQNPELVAQELLLFENAGSDDLEDVVDPLFRTARVTMRVPWLDAIAYPAFLDDLGARVSEIFGDELEVEITGLVPVLSRTFRAMLESMARSYVVAILVIAPLMILLIGNLFRGLLSMIPNLTPVILSLGFMGWSGLPVDGLTMMVGAIVIGLAVDDTIHFMHNFRRYYEQTGDARIAIERTLETTGQALLVTSLVLAAGFFVYLGAYMSNVRTFGLLAGGAILVAFLANVVLSSALMVLASRGRGGRAAASA